MDKNKATFETLQLQAETSTFDKIEAMTYFSSQGLPLEIVTRISNLCDKTVEIGGQIIDIGIIIIMKLIKFIKQNPNMAIGVALGLGLGFLAHTIPYIGFFIAPIVTVVFATVGALRGHRMDKIMNGEYVGDSLIEDAITIVKRFWNFMYEIFSVIFTETSLEPSYNI